MRDNIDFVYFKNPPFLNSYPNQQQKTGQDRLLEL
jgi:hypothetical protein